MTKESQVPVDDYRWRAADAVARASERALRDLRAASGRACEPERSAAIAALIEETERALEMASRALADNQIEEN
jgi:hypothetical protein